VPQHNRARLLAGQLLQLSSDFAAFTSELNRLPDGLPDSRQPADGNRTLRNDNDRELRAAPIAFDDGPRDEFYVIGQMLPSGAMKGDVLQPFKIRFLYLGGTG
jgi:hypothetical protein